MNPTRNSPLSIETDVVLHGMEVRKPAGGHLCLLPVLLEPSPVITMNAQVKHPESGYLRTKGTQVLFKVHEYPLLPLIGISLFRRVLRTLPPLPVL